MNVEIGELFWTVDQCGSNWIMRDHICMSVHVNRYYIYIYVYVFISPSSACSAGLPGKGNPIGCKQPLHGPSKNMLFV